MWLGAREPGERAKISGFDLVQKKRENEIAVLTNKTSVNSISIS